MVGTFALLVGAPMRYGEFPDMPFIPRPRGLPAMGCAMGFVAFLFCAERWMERWCGMAMEF
jgi:hypothetical protein